MKVMKDSNTFYMEYQRSQGQKVQNINTQADMSRWI